MSKAIELELQQARADRTAGKADIAERGYARAAELARSQSDRLALAHALRHLSDLARERGAPAEARTHAREAVALYRESSDRLGLANALRLQALSAGDDAESRRCWEQARTLYAELNVGPGVAECERQLGI